MRLVILHMRGSVAINGIFSLKWRYYGLKEYIWTIKEYFYFFIIITYILSRDKRYIGLDLWVLKSWYKIPLIVLV